MLRNKLIVSLIFFSLFRIEMVPAQELAFDWVRAWSWDEGNTVYPTKVATDPAGNTYIGARIFSDSDLDPGADTAQIQYIGGGELQYVICKFDQDGEFLWSSWLYYDVYSGEGINDFEADKNGNLIIAGYTNAEILYIKDSDTTFVSTDHDWDAYVIKIDSSGQFEWSRNFGGIYDDEIESIRIDEDGNIYAAGFFADSVQFQASEPKVYAEWYDLVVLKYDSDGNIIWRYNTEITGGTVWQVEITDIDFDPIDQIVSLTGNYLDYYNDTLDFEHGPGVSNLLVKDNRNIFILQLNTTDGSFHNVLSYGGDGTDKGLGLVYDTQGNYYLAGETVLDTISFDSTRTDDDVNVGTSFYNYIVKFDNNNQYQWVKEIHANGGTQNIGLEIDRFDDLIIYGSLNTSMYWYSQGTQVQLTATPGASYDMFIVKFDSDSNYIWSGVYGTSSTDHGRDLATDYWGNVFGVMTSSGNDTIVFGNIESPGSYGHFFKLTPCGHELIHQLNDSTVYADALNVDYQWLDCDNGYSVIPGDTNRFFTAQSSGSYALEASSYGCIDTSECVFLTNNSIIASFYADSVCLGQYTSFIDSSFYTAGSISYEWDFDGDGSVDDNTQGNVSYLYSSAGNYSAILKINDGSGGSSSDTTEVYVFESPTVDAGDNQSIEYGLALTIAPFYSSNVTNVIWEPTSSLDDPTLFNPTATPVSTQMYTVEAFTAEGCSARDSIEITVNVFIPTGFTPDGDGVNDLWEIPFLADYPNATMVVYDRSGQKVFSGSGDEFWDGTYKDQPAPTGAYYFVLDLGNDEVHSGHVNLIRVNKK